MESDAARISMICDCSINIVRQISIGFYGEL